MSKDESTKNEKKVGVYVCHCGGNISDVVDVEAVRKALEPYNNVVVSKTNMFMCSNAGQDLIEEDIKTGKINRVIVASCTPNLHKETFRGATVRGGLNQYLYEHVNIREQDSWVHDDDHDGATKKAIHLVKAAVNRSLTDSFVSMDSLRVPIHKHVLIIGGGISGLKSAIDLANKGISVDLIEKTPYLGGRVAQLDELYPTAEKSTDILNHLYSEALNNPKITIHLSSIVESVSGYIGNFNVKIKKVTNEYIKNLDEKYLNIAVNSCPEIDDDNYQPNGINHQKALIRPYPGNYPKDPIVSWRHCTKCGKCKEVIGEKGNSIDLDFKEEIIDIKTGVIIAASGFKHYKPKKGEYGYKDVYASNKSFPLVVTMPQFIRMLSPEGIFKDELKWQNISFDNIVLIHCVGSRQLEEVNEPQEDGLVNDYCSRVCCTATLQLANELKERYPNVNIYDVFQDIRSYGRYHETDYYEKACKNGVKFVRYVAEEPPQVTPSKREILVKVKDRLTFNEEIEIPADLVVLSVGIMPGNDSKNISELFNIPIGSDRFLLEGHPKLKPVETTNSGILLAGTVQAPMDTTEASAAASAAAVKAAILLSSDEFELEPFVARVDPSICLGEECSKCISQCGYDGVLQMVPTKINGEIVQRAHVNEILCKGCGACVAVCPVRGAIEVAGYNIEQFEAMVNAFVKEL